MGGPARKRLRSSLMGVPPYVQRCEPSHGSPSASSRRRRITLRGRDAYVLRVGVGTLALEDSVPELSDIAERLQAEYPGEFSEANLRTLQRRVKAWRADAARRLVFAHHDCSPAARHSVGAIPS